MNDFSEISLDLINQGSALMAQENFEEALKKFKEAQQESPKYVECYLNLGNVLACLENYEEAIDAFKKALMLDEKSAEALFGLGNIMYLQDNIIDAVKYYNQAESTGDLSDEMCDVIAELFVSEGDHTQALRYLNKAIKKNPLKGEYYLEKVKIFIDTEKIDEAIETLKEFNSIIPDAYEPYDMLAEIYSIKGEYQKAIKVVNDALNKFPEDSNIASLKLKILSDSDKNDEALEFYNVMKEKNLFEERKEDNALILSDIYLKRDDIQSAVDILENSSDETYSQDKIAFVLTSIYLKLENFEKAIYITEKVLQRETTLFYATSAQFYHAQALLACGKQHEAEKEFKEITSDFRRVTVLNPSFYEGYAYRLLAHRALKEFDEALKLADYMENVFPNRPDGHIFKYMIYTDLGDASHAEIEKNNVKELDPNFIF